MKERPIIFSGPSIPAILRGDKTQTRRIAKFPPLVPGLNLGFTGLVPEQRGDLWVLQSRDGSGAWNDRTKAIRCPYGVPGDRLWVREAWQYYDRNPDGTRDEWFEGPNVPPVGNEVLLAYWRKRLIYRADGDPDPVHPVKWRSPRFMPRWASRILLEITDVRVQRVQEISEEDARAEGIEPLVIDPLCPVGTNKYTLRFGGGWHNAPTAREVFRMLWNHIHGSCAWERNEWVWAVTFKIIEARRAA